MVLHKVDSFNVSSVNADTNFEFLFPIKLLAVKDNVVVKIIVSPPLFILQLQIFIWLIAYIGRNAY